MNSVLSYGGGRQTIAICVLIARGVLPRPDRIVMADTGRENPTTWEYLAAHVRPMLLPLGLVVEVVPPTSPSPDVWSKAGDPIIPVFTETGKYSAFCSGTWKRDRVNSYLSKSGERGGEKWLGFALDEGKRIRRAAESDGRSGWKLRFPLTELMLTTEGCLALISSAGYPPPSVSSCWMCPHKRNAEWRAIRDSYPDRFEDACLMDEELRAEDIERGGSGVWLHHSRTPLRAANLDTAESATLTRQCGLGMCFV